MKVGKKIWRVLTMVLWLIAGTGVIVLFVAAVNVKTSKQCKGFSIDISGAEEFMFLDKDDLVRIITKNGEDPMKGKPLAAIDLHALELAIATNVWVHRAELFFDNNLVLHVNVIEKEPVARVFTESGSSFYIDSSGAKLPLSAKMNIKLPVFTSFPEVIGKWSKKDSLVVRQVSAMSEYILHNEFWMAQVAQVSCEPDGSFEIVPMVGNHRIIFGDGNGYENKFRKLFIFYQNVLSRAGVDRYASINLSYENQVVATRNSAKPLIEPIKLIPADSTARNSNTSSSPH